MRLQGTGDLSHLPPNAIRNAGDGKEDETDRSASAFRTIPSRTQNKTKKGNHRRTGRRLPQFDKIDPRFFSRLLKPLPSAETGAIPRLE